MSSVQQRDESVQMLDTFERFFQQEYKDEIGELALEYPNDRRSLIVDWGDLFRFAPDLADDWLNKPGKIQEYAEEALALFDLPVDVSLDNAHVRMVGLNSAHVYGVGDLRSKHNTRYIGVRGHLAQVTGSRSKIEEAAFECGRCGTLNYISQTKHDFQEPHECQGCERQGPFNVNFDQSEFVDQRKVQIKQPPEDAENGEGATIAAYLEDDIVDPPGVSNLESHVGEDVVVYGKVELKQETDGQSKSSLMKQYIQADGVDFERADEQIDPYEYKDEFEAVAKSEDAYQMFIENMAPGVYPYGNWPLGFKLAAAYLFGSPRVDRKDGSTHRGDIHMAIFGPPGIGKSLFSESIADLSPGCEHRSATGLSSDVGLTAAATQDDFAEGDGWVLKPGILPRAEDHAILDEADKADVKLSKINDALEGKQMATIDKGGINARLKTRVGFMAMGNPNDGRWNDHDPIKEQVDIDDSLWSRFDGIVILEDDPDEDMDGELADHKLNSYREDAAKEKADQQGHDPEEAEREATETELSREALKAWIMYARENVFPELTDDAHARLKEYYVDIRTDSNNADNSHPTARKLDAGIRFSVAFARMRLSDRVDETDVEMAIDLSKALVGQTFDSDHGLDYAALSEIPSAKAQEQDERINTILGIVADMDDGEDAADIDDVVEIARDRGIDPENARRYISKLKQNGRMYEPQQGSLRVN